MNRNLHRTIYNMRLGALVAVAEFTRARTKRPGAGSASGATPSSTAGGAPRFGLPTIARAGASVLEHPGRFSARGALVPLAAACALWGEEALAAPPLPAGGTITQGTGTISQSGNTLTVSQSSQSLTANWQSFDIGSGNAVVFHQPNSSAVALNRVIGPDASSIYGSLSANGKVFLVNPNGVLFAPGSQVSVGGLVASTLGVSDADFASGHYRFTQGDGTPGTVTNQGNINAGSVALIGPQLTNSGTIATPGGNTTLAAGQQVTVELMSNGLLTAQVDVAAANAQIQNHGRIVADGGSVSLQAGRADTVLDTLIDTDGLIQAHSVRNENGTVYLDGGAGGTVTVSGTVDASGSGSGAHGGNITALGKNVGLMSGAQVNASGEAGGGTVLIGGNEHGQGPEMNAEATYMDPTAVIHADDTSTGNGGQVVLWSDNYTGFYGAISAHGGPSGGNGGQVETSSHDNLQAFGTVDASAPKGAAGQWLMDPADVTIIIGSANTNDTDSGGVFTPSASSAQIGATNISSDLNAGTSVTITTTGGSGGNGDITVSSAITKTGSVSDTLTLDADRNIMINAGINDNSATGTLNVVLDAHYSNDTAVGNVTFNGNGAFSLTTHGGNVIIGGGSNPAITPAIGLSGTSLGRGVYVNNTTIDAGGGNITINGQGGANLASGELSRGVEINIGSVKTSGTGTISFTGTGGSGGSAGDSYGVNITSAGGNTSISTASGALTITGTGGTVGSSAGSMAGVTFRGGLTDSVFSTTGPITLQGTALNAGAPAISGTSGTTANLGWDGGTNISSGNLTLTGTTPAGSTAGAGGITLPGVKINGNGGSLAIDSSTRLSGLTLGSGVIATGAAWSSVTIGDANTGAIVDGGNVVTASGAMNVTGGSYTFTGANTFTGNSFAFGNVNAIANSGSLTFSETSATSIPNAIGGTGSLVQAGAGTLSLTAANSYSGTTTINAGDVLQIGGAGSLGSGGYSSNIIDNGTLQYSSGAPQTLSGVISGTGNLAKDTSPSTLTLTNNNTLTGTVTVSAGTLSTQAGNTATGALGTASAITINNGGTVSVGGDNSFVGGTPQAAQTITINSGGALVDNNGSANHLSAIVLNGGTISETGGARTDFGNWDLDNGVSTAGSGNTSTITGGNAMLSQSGGAIFNVKTGDTLTVSTELDHTAFLADTGLTKQGAGTLILTGNNTYDGTTTINGGTLAITNASALGSTNGGTVVNGGANLDLQNVAVGAESVTLAGGSGAYGTLTTSTGTSSLSGPVTLAGPSYSYFNVANGAQLTVSGVISGSGAVYTSNAGTLVFSGTNTYSGGTLLALGSSGTLAITNDSALGTGGVNLRVSTTLDLRNVTISEPIAGNGGTLLASTGVNTISGSVSSFSSVPVNVSDGAQLTIASNMSAPTPLTKNGNGLLTLTGNNTRAGTTTINAGTVQVGNGGASGALGSGAVTVASGANLIFDRSDSVSLSTLASNAGGITGQGNLTALIGGGFTVDRAITLNGANSNILLEAGKNNAAGDASGGDVTLSSAVTTGATGTVTIFSGDANTAALESEVGGASGSTRYKTYGASAASTSGAITGTRNYYYRQAPTTLTIGGLTATKAYDGLVDATSVLNTSGATVSGLLDGDALGAGSLTLASAAFDSAHAGMRTVNATFSGTTPTYSGGGATWSVSGYSSTANLAGSGSGTIMPHSVTTSINPVGKTYDGTTSTISALAAPTGFIGNDSATGASMGLGFDDPNAGTRNVVAIGTGTLLGFSGAARGNGSGVGAGNEVAGLASDYALATPSPAAAVIAPALLTITANNDAKVLTQSDAPGYNGVSYTGFVHGENPSVLAGTLSITRSNAGTEAAGTYTGVLVPSGLSASNYTISFVNGDYQILPAQQLLVKVANVTSAYGTSLGYTITSAEYLDGSGSSLHALTQTAQSGNTFTYSDGVGGSVTFTVTPQGVVTSGAGYLAAGNYALSGTKIQVSGNNFLGLSFVGNESVTPLALTPLPSAGVTKVYDGTTAMTGLTLGLSGQLAGDTVQVNGFGAFSSRNAGTNIGYNVNGMSLAGPDAGNYYLTANSLNGTNGVITPRPITVSGITAGDKIYDGTSAATLTTAGSILNGIVAGDTVAFDGSGYSALFGDKNVGTGKSVTISGLSLTGTDAGNYTLTQPIGLTANITPRPLTITAVSDTKTYDGTTSSSLTPTVAGLVGGDTVSGAALQRFDDRNAGTGKTLTAATGSLTINDGNGGNNYAPTFVDNTTGVINPRPLTVTAIPDSKPFDGTTRASATPMLSGDLASGDRFTVLGEQYANSGVGAGLSLIPLVGIDDGNGGANYALTLVDDNAGEIQPGLDLPALGGSNVTSRLNGDTGSSTNGNDDRVSSESSELANIARKACTRSGSRGSGDAHDAVNDTPGQCASGGAQTALIDIVSSGIRLPPRLTTGEDLR